jgi:hypothetical protein
MHHIFIIIFIPYLLYLFYRPLVEYFRRNLWCVNMRGKYLEVHLLSEAIIWAFINEVYM